NIINQLYNAVQSSQNTDTFNLKNIVNTVTKVLNEEFGLNIDSKDVLNLLKNSKTNDVKILPNSGVVEVGNSKIESKLSVNS
ncbi:hypothetical protein U2060_15270, partial [Listeria monocytogenes]|uniref:hypothetical protein n=1 Tax=Listeria monocytogenes TaxID=1639 RepID=UPI002FDBF9E7